MALRSGYKGFKKLINGLKVLRPGVLGIDIGTGLAIGQDGKLNVTGVDVTVAGNPEEAATAGDLTKLQIGDDIFNIPDTTYSNATTSAAGLMSPEDKAKLNGLNKNDYLLRSEQDILGAKNLLKINEGSYSNNGVSYSVDNDGVLSLNNTATADSYANIGTMILPAGDYIVSGCEGGSLSTYYLDIFSGGSRVVACVDGDASFTLAAESTLNIYPNVKNGTDVSGIKIYPMIRLASDPDATFAPYAMTNKELTEKAFIYKGVVPANTNLNDLTASGIYVCDGNAITNAPSDFNGYGKLEVLAYVGLTLQIIYGAGAMYTRIYAGSTWRNWFKYTGTELT